jgi:hypothetical protein
LILFWGCSVEKMKSLVVIAIVIAQIYRIFHKCCFVIVIHFVLQGIILIILMFINNPVK